MGHFRVAVEVGDRAGERFVPIEALVDTGATYTWVPRDVLEGLGVGPEEDWPFVLADGREVHYPVAWTQVRIGTRARPTIVVLGEPGSEAILGVFALEGFALAADPANRRLISVPGLLKVALPWRRPEATVVTPSARAWAGGLGGTGRRPARGSRG